MKKFLMMILTALVGFGLCSGCNLGSVSTDDIADYVSGVEPGQAVSLATNLLALPAIQNLANAIMADSNLVATLTNAWNEVEGDYVTPDEIEDGTAPPAAGDASTALPKIGGGKTIAGWAPVNFWWNMDDATIRDGLAYMQSCNVRWFCPEAVGNAGEDMLGSSAKLDRMKSRWLLTQAECKARGVWFAPILFNDNAGDGAYQNGGVKLENRMAQAKALIDWVAANGDKSVLSITIVSEIQTSAGKQLEAYGLAKLGGAGFRLDYNGSSRPSSKPAGYTGLRVWHACDVNSWPSKDVVWLNDCGTSIRSTVAWVNEGGPVSYPSDYGEHIGSVTEAIGPRAMNLNGDLNGMGDPAKIAAKKTEAVARGVYVFAIYGFQVRTFDKPTIKALSMPADSPPAPPTESSTLDLSKVTWLHYDVSAWPVTTTLSASVSKTRVVTLSYDKAKIWPAVDGLNANPWIIVKWTDGKLYAATWEWLRHGQTSKTMTGKSWGDHIKVAPLSKWEPKSGEKAWMLVSGLARDAKRSARERSQPVEVVFP